MITILAEVVKKALQGGWSPKYGHHEDLVDDNGEWIGVENSRVISYAEIALDPLFWYALGKTLGWSEYAVCDTHGAKCEVGCTAAVEKEFLYHAHRFYDLILTGGDTTEFWQELLNNK